MSEGKTGPTGWKKDNQTHVVVAAAERMLRIEILK